MIARVRGKVVHLKPAEVIIETAGGTGYHLFVPLGVSSSLEEGCEAVLEASMYVREDLVRLYGFGSMQEKQVFETLLRVSGVGPSMALALLSGMGVPSLIQAVEQNNIAAMCTVPGIGKVKAEKLLFELRRHLPRLRALEPAADGEKPAPSVSEDAISALVVLGYDEATARKTVQEIQATTGEQAVDALVRGALRALSR